MTQIPYISWARMQQRFDVSREDTIAHFEDANDFNVDLTPGNTPLGVYESLEDARNAGIKFSRRDLPAVAILAGNDGKFYDFRVYTTNRFSATPFGFNKNFNDACGDLDLAHRDMLTSVQKVATDDGWAIDGLRFDAKSAKLIVDGRSRVYKVEEGGKTDGHPIEFKNPGSSKYVWLPKDLQPPCYQPFVPDGAHCKSYGQWNQRHRVGPMPG